eukprot:m.154155 g.154155  ORF g.154155 m.154155 type:complete len:155 (+) comp14365_c0_seq3:70-534(+)
MRGTFEPLLPIYARSVRRQSTDGHVVEIRVCARAVLELLLCALYVHRSIGEGIKIEPMWHSPAYTDFCLSFVHSSSRSDFSGITVKNESSAAVTRNIVTLYARLFQKGTVLNLATLSLGIVVLHKHFHVHFDFTKHRALRTHSLEDTVVPQGVI